MGRPHVEVLQERGKVRRQLSRGVTVRGSRRPARASMVRQDDETILGESFGQRAPALTGAAKTREHQYGRISRIAQKLVVHRHPLCFIFRHKFSPCKLTFAGLLVRSSNN